MDGPLLELSSNEDLGGRMVCPFTLPPHPLQPCCLTLGGKEQGCLTLLLNRTDRNLDSRIPDVGICTLGS